jgi:hypothetical protein
MSDVEGDDSPAAAVASSGGAMGIDTAIKVRTIYG